MTADSPDCLRRMVVNDSPAGRGAAEEQREDTMRFVLWARELPAAEDPRGVGSEQRDFDVGKRELAHLFAGGVFFPVTIADRLPAARELVAGNKFGCVRAGVAFH